MTLFASMSSGVSGLLAQGNKLSVISDNIANSNTTGYKESQANFRTMILDDTATAYSPGGVMGGHRQLNNIQGGIVPTLSQTDLAISGLGFLPVSQATAGGNIVYTRAGAFTEDQNGDFINTAGFFLQGWQLDADGNLPTGLSASTIPGDTGIAALTTVNVRQFNERPKATTQVTLQANLNTGETSYAGTPAYNPTNPAANMTGGVIAPDYGRPITVVDGVGDGTEHTLSVSFLKTGINTWAVEIYGTASDITSPGTQISYGTITFDGTGALASVSPALLSAQSITWQNGATNDITFDWGTIGAADGLTQLNSGYNIQTVHQNGFLAGSLENISITADGLVKGTFNNGDTLDLYKIPLAMFNSPDQLQRLSSNVYAESSESGDVSFVAAGQTSVGVINAGSLESSNVDIASQMTDMIAAQSAYQYNAKLITVTNEMLQGLSQIGQ